MANDPLREPKQIRAGCARNLAPIETSDMLTAVHAALLEEDWTTPKVEELDERHISLSRYLVRIARLF